MSVQHLLPVGLVDGLSAGLTNPDSVVVKMHGGGRGSRSYGDYEMTTYAGMFIDLDANTDDLEKLRALLRHIDQNVIPFWILEPFVFAHDELFCGPLADGSQIAFICPLNAATEIFSVLEDGVYTDDYTHHEKSNIIANDNDANAVLSVGAVTNEGGSTVVSRKVGLGAAGRTCFKVVQAAAANNGLKIASLAVDSGQLYKFRVTVKGAGSFFISVTENGTGTPTTTSTPAITGVPGDWVDVDVEKTMLGDTTSVELIVYRSEATAATWFAGAIGAHPGGFEQWFPPDSCPGVIEFDSAPAINTRVLCGGRGKVLRRVAFDTKVSSWQLFTTGHARPQTFRATEVMES